MYYDYRYDARKMKKLTELLSHLETLERFVRINTDSGPDPFLGFIMPLTRGC
jgi:hypothetical protein